MPYKRIAAAAALLLAAVYLKLAMPPLYDEVRPAVERGLDADQLALPLPEAVSVWLDWD